MKKKRSTLLVVILCLTMSVWALAGCGGSSDDGTDASSGDGGDAKYYSSSEITSEAAYAEDVQAFYDNVDMEYAYNLSEELAYNWDDYAEACGWRTAGSDSEHACADFLAGEMEKIGLQNVEKIPTACDKFQFNGSSLKIKDSKVDFKGGDQDAVEAGTNGPASYQVNGTDGDLEAKIVDVGTGTEAEYEDVGFEEGDIAFAKVDQSNEAWIDVYMNEAYNHGASAIITWANSGYGEAGSFTNNTQDVCCGDLLPSASLSADQAKMVKKAIKNGHDQAILNIDAEMVDNGGTTDNVCGMIPGKNHDQKIIISAHYDKYWYGFQDDCAAIGLIMATGKSLVDSGYEPENDIYIVCHGAEEWGVTDSMYDWTTGAWGMCEENGMADDVICMLNFELPAFDCNNKLAIASVPEFQTTSAKILNEGIVVTAGKETIAYETVDTTNMEDGISYREYGTPYYLNNFEGTDFMSNNYHTIADNKDTYSETVFQTNINWTGAYAIYADNTPAVELDFTATANRMKDNFNGDYAEEAGVDVDAYKAALKEFKAAGKAMNEKIAGINDKYAKAIADGDQEAADAARAEAVELNEINLQAFQMVQDDFLKVTDFDCSYGHSNENATAEALDGILAALDVGKGPIWGENGDGIADGITALNGVVNYYYCNYSMETADREYAAHTMDYYKSKDQAMWAWNHMYDMVDTGEMDYKVYHVEDLSEFSEDEIAELKEGYSAARDEMISYIGKWSEKEMAQFKEIAAVLK
ncbi:MAG: M28 family peptidase [Eubacteriales bacterium]|nr:M28 family peptidase [Eubacteriales bacterium]